VDGVQGLLERARQQVAQAITSGALQPVSTGVEMIDDGGVQWLVHVLERIERKQRAGLEQARTGSNPFLDPEPDLLVAEVSASHRCVLNKFNVLDTHLLIVTRDFKPQLSGLDLADMEALSLCLAEIDGLGFYNGGTVAGASQAHRHLQLVPLPLAPGSVGMPTERLLPSKSGSVADFRFRHAFARLPAGDGATLFTTCNRLLAELAVDPTRDPWNLLVTRSWMLAVARSQEHWQGVSVNALGYAGSLLVRDRSSLEQLRQVGPMAVLEAVSVADR
jgi:ATP adenylyltransferase